MSPAIPHEEVLKAKYVYSAATIKTSHQITKRVTALLQALQADDEANGPVVAALQASAPATNKLISITEIVKRECKSAERLVFQYTALSSEVVPVKPRTATEQAQEDSDDAFEPVQRQSPETEQRQSPVLTIYLATTSIKELRTAYGEQKA